MGGIMAKYYIKSYVKEPQNFMAAINSMDHTYGNIHEPYSITLERVGWFGMKSEVVRKVSLPRGFNHQKELTTGREWVG
jgi:hypothetical protein